MTEECQKSLISLSHCVKVEIDTKKYDTAVAGAWNAFFDKWRGEEYDYLMITANDTIADVNAIDYMIQCAQENPNAGIISGHVTRDKEQFKKNYGQAEYSGELTQGYHNMDPACFLLPKGVIEKIIKSDEMFPREFVERDLIYRIKLAGYDWVEPRETLWYHPPYSGTIGNPGERLQIALRKYVAKWGADAGQEKFRYPYNDFRLDYSFTGPYDG